MRSSRLIRWSPIYWTLTVVGVAYCALVLLGVVRYGGCFGTDFVMCDAAAYYFTPTHPYRWDLLPDGVAPFRYAPAFLIVFAPFRWLPWELFAALWFSLHVAAFIWLGAGWMLAIPGINDDVLRGNVTVFLAVAAVLAVTRNGYWWIPVLLSKVTPGIAAAWHLARREWWQFTLAVGGTAVVVAVGLLITPGLWRDWFTTLANGPDTYEVGHLLGPLWLRLPVAGAVALYGGWSSRAWLVPIAMVIAVPGLWPLNLALLAAVPRLLTWRANRSTLVEQ